MGDESQIWKFGFFLAILPLEPVQRGSQNGSLFAFSVMELFFFLLSFISLLFLPQYSPSKFDIPFPPGRARTIGFVSGAAKKKGTGIGNKVCGRVPESSTKRWKLRREVDQWRRGEDKSQIAKQLHNRHFLDKRSEVCGGAEAFIKVPSNRKRNFVEIFGQWFGWGNYGNLGGVRLLSATE